MFLRSIHLPSNQVWFAEICVKGWIPRLLLVRRPIKVAKNIAEDVKYSYFIWEISVLAVGWH
ncbi:hypothetical protein DYY65_11975 [Nitrososphaera sp. AFS]|nr:hypothetical protein [Nitrososphaera sp. AFS]